MFDLTEAKRIRRSALFQTDSASSKHSSRSSTPINVPNCDLFKFEYDFHAPPASFGIQPKHGTTPAVQNNINGGNEDGTFEFRLFASKALDEGASTSTTTAPAIVNRITIHSPTPPPTNSAGRFVNPYRPQDYYFTETLDAPDIAKLKAEYAAVAVDGASVLSLAKRTRWPGTSLAWRVTHLNLPPAQSTHPAKPPPKSASNPRKSPLSTTKANSIYIPFSQHPRTTRRNHPSKRLRILFRKRQSTTQSTFAADAAKRTARNREKKVKRKAREKAEKAEKAKKAAAILETG